MISDCDKRSSIKSLRSASLVSSLFESATSIIHPLEPKRLEPNVEIEIESPNPPERHSLFDSTQLSHAGRSLSTRSSDINKSVQHKRWEMNV